MAINYDKLWKLISEKNISKSILRDKIGASQSTIVRMGKNQFVSLEVIDKICNALKCFPDDIISYVPDSELSSDGTLSFPRIQRGDIFYANLSTSSDMEQSQLRPVLVVQNNAANKHGASVVVVPITSMINKIMPPTQVHITLDNNTCLFRESCILCDQIRTLGKTKLADKIGSLPIDLMEKVDKAIMIALDLSL